MLQGTPRFTREGFYFICVLLFIIGGAVVRQLNLLVILTGMLLGPLIFHARLVSLLLRGIRVVRKVPPRACAGEPLHVRLNIRNERRHVSSWLIVVRDRIQLETDQGHPSVSHVDVRVPHVPPHDETSVNYRLCLTRRGRYRLGPLRISTRFPIGLLSASRTLNSRDELLVYPRMGHMTTQWSSLIYGEQAGSQQSRSRQGLTEAEFYGLREWRPGDSRRWVHWRTSARLNTLAVRQFEQQRKADMALLIDLWLPAKPSAEELLHLETTISFAATAITELGREASARLAVTIAAKGVESFSGVASTTFADEILERLALIEGGDSPLPAAFDRLLHIMPEGAHGIVISSRPNQIPRIDLSSNRRSERLQQLLWIDVSGPQRGKYFYFSPTK